MGEVDRLVHISLERGRNTTHRVVIHPCSSLVFLCPAEGLSGRHTHVWPPPPLYLLGRSHRSMGARAGLSHLALQGLALSQPRVWGTLSAQTRAWGVRPRPVSGRSVAEPTRSGPTGLRAARYRAEHGRDLPISPHRGRVRCGDGMSCRREISLQLSSGATATGRSASGGHASWAC